jgi:hypothetical protein
MVISKPLWSPHSFFHLEPREKLELTMFLVKTQKCNSKDVQITIIVARSIEVGQR